MSPTLLSERYVKWGMGRKELIRLRCRRKRERVTQGRRKPMSCPELPSAQSLPHAQPRNEKASGARYH